MRGCPGLADIGALDNNKAMSFSILIVDDEPDISDLFRQRFRREVRQGRYVLHFAASGEDALRRLYEIRPRADRDLVRYKHARDG
jgi:CheY-like chemotaxis protein